MDELVNLVAGKVGISPEQAEKAVTTVMGFLKEKAAWAHRRSTRPHRRGRVGGGGGLDVGAVEGALGGLFGKK